VTTDQVPKTPAESNIIRFVVDLQHTGGGASQPPVPQDALDCDLHGWKFRGFKLTNRGNTYELSVQESELPPGPADDVVVILDRQQMRWGDALAVIRSRPQATTEDS